MANCEMCGKKAKLIPSKVEGVTMQLCSSCSSYGSKVQAKKYSSKRSRSFEKMQQPEERLKTNFGSLIKQAREKKGTTIEQVAQQLNEKESLMRKIESQQVRPNFAVAKKLEKHFKITLLEKNNPEETKEYYTNQQEKKSNSSGLTMGDILQKALDKKNKK